MMSSMDVRQINASLGTNIKPFASVREIMKRLEDRGRLHIAEEVAKKHNMPVTSVLGRSRHASVAAARNELYAALRRTALSYPEVGYLVDRDHTTVLYGARRFSEQPAVEPVEKLRIAV